MLRALAFVAVRQHQRQAVGTAPLHFAGRDELVDHHLGAVDEVAELRFPDHQRVRIGRRVAELEGQHGLLGQQRVDDDERRLLVGDVLQRRVGAGVELLAVLVVQHRVAVRERAAARVLARQADRIAAGHQRRERHVLAHAPVDVDLAPAHRGAVGDHLLDQRVQLEVARDRGDAFGQALELGHGNRGVGGVRPLLVQERRPVDRVLALEVGQHRVMREAAGVHRGAELLDHVVRARLRQHALGDQLVAVQLARARVQGDLLVHQRLRQAGRVLLVVAQLAEADDVDDHVLVELLAIVQRELRAQHDRFRIVAVDVQHRRLDHLDDVGAVQRGARVARVGRGEADLVVDHHVDGAARVVAARLRQRQRLHDHALAREGRVAVDDDRQHLRALRVAAAIHARLDGALDDRVDDLEMGRVERQRQVDRATGGGDVAGEALVVLDVAGRQLFGRRVVELGEQVLGHLAQRVHEHVQAAAVGHADDDLLHALGAGALHQFVHRDDEALAAFEREALLADELRVQVALEAFGGRQAVEDVLLFLGVVGGLAADRLDALLPPALLAGIGDVHELGADGAAVRLAQRLQDLAQRHVLVGREIRVRRRERDVHVGFGQVVERRIELGNLGTLGALERIEVGPARAEEAVRGDQRLDMDLLARDGEVGRAGLDGERVGLGALREGLDHRRVRDVAGIRAVGGGHMLERVEVGAPRIRHGAGVLEIGLVHLFHVGRVTAEQVGVGPVLFHHLSLTFRSGFRNYDGLINLPRPGSTGWRIANALLLS